MTDSKGIRLEKNKYDIVYNIRIFLLWSAYILICIQYFLSWQIEGSDVICRYLTASCLILSFKYERVNLFFIFSFIFLIIAFVFRRLLIVWCLYAIVYQFIDYRIPLKKIVKIAVVVLSLIFIVLIDGLLIGLFENEGEKYIKSTAVIYDLGTGNANRCASLFFKFVILLYLLLKNNHPYYLISGILIISYIGYDINGSRAVLATSLLLAFLSILYWNNGFRNWMKYFIAVLPIMMYFLTFYLAFNLEDFKEFNKIASGRLWYIMKFTQDFTLKEWLFGAPRTIDDPLDSSYLEIIHTGGICLASFFCIAYFIVIITNYKRIIPFLPVMITMLVMGLSESILLRPTDISVIFWMIILKNILQKPILTV